jgi:hypothetical protein
VRGRRIAGLSSQEATVIGVIVSFEFVEVAALVDNVPAAVA